MYPTISVMPRVSCKLVCSARLFFTVDGCHPYGWIWLSFLWPLPALLVTVVKESRELGFSASFSLLLVGPSLLTKRYPQGFLHILIN
jgi:hypothetical protein